VHINQSFTRYRLTVLRDPQYPFDFYKLVSALLSVPGTNAAVVFYSRALIDKPNLFAAMQKEFGLHCEITEATASVNARDSKPHYHSLDTRNADFGYKPSPTSKVGILIAAREVLLRARRFLA
jgi:hypothetical protein